MAMVISVGAFFIMAILLWGAYDLVYLQVFGYHTEARRRLAADPKRPDGKNPHVDIVKKNALAKDEGFIDTLMAKFTPVDHIRILLRGADSDMPAGVFVLLSAFLGVCGLGLAVYLDVGLLLEVAGALGGGALPYLYHSRAKKKRLKAIENQLPDALDLIARTLQAGHAFIMGLKLASEQVEEPLRSEFARAFEEINFGVSVQESMTDMSIRVDSLDVKFFVTSLVVQLETGGNLAEIIDSISRLIRSRFELMGKIQALTAEGRISAQIMFALPVVVGAGLFAMNQDYMMLLFTDPLGKSMLTGGFSMMVLGMLVTRKMIQIKM